MRLCVSETFAYKFYNTVYFLSFLSSQFESAFISKYVFIKLMLETCLCAGSKIRMDFICLISIAMIHFFACICCNSLRVFVVNIPVSFYRNLFMLVCS